VTSACGAVNSSPGPARLSKSHAPLDDLANHSAHHSRSLPGLRSSTTEIVNLVASLASGEQHGDAPHLGAPETAGGLRLV